MARMYFSKMGKVLLEVEEKYSNQIKKILEFKRKEHRVLITTSVTEEGFDIPGCNLVISFDTPFSLKSYIQIKGRARKKNSRYIIFTNDQKSHYQMQ
jgi:endoribonuclease Dicer